MSTTLGYHRLKKKLKSFRKFTIICQERYQLTSIERSLGVFPLAECPLFGQFCPPSRVAHRSTSLLFHLLKSAQLGVVRRQLCPLPRPNLAAGTHQVSTNPRPLIKTFQTSRMSLTPAQLKALTNLDRMLFCKRIDYICFDVLQSTFYSFFSK